MFLFRLTNVTKRFGNRRKSFAAVNGVSFELPQSGLVSIFGKSGCGKSTLLNMLMGIEKVSKGSILFKRRKLNRFSKKRMSNYRLKDVSMIYQHYNLLDGLSAIDNILLPLQICGESNSKSLKTAKEYLQKFNVTYLEKQNIKNLSGGEKQRIAIIRALVTNPSAILCDEPTGALDEANSIFVMDKLKEISKARLVVIVSHNKSLIEKYSDRIIEMRDGKIVSDNLRRAIKDTALIKSNKIRYRENWVWKFIRNLFKRYKFKQLFAFLSLSIGLVSVFIGVGFINGSKQSQQVALTNNLSICCSTISQTSYYSVSNSPLQFKKSVRPSANILDPYLEELENVVVKPNPSYFFSNVPNAYFLNEKIDNFELIPLINQFLDNNENYPKTAGDFMLNEISSVLVNNDFLETLGIGKNEAINTEFLISNSVPISYRTNSDDYEFITDNFSYSIKMKIAGVVDEFSFMNTPKVYYSYDALYSFLTKSYLSEIGKILNRPFSIIDYLEETSNDSPESSYSSYIFLTDAKSYQKLFKLIDETIENEEIIQIDSKAYTISNTYNSFISSFQDALLFFLIIGFLGVVFILGMISLSNYLENKKESAVLTCLGAREKSISKIYLTYNVLITILSFVVSIIVAPFAEKVLNEFLKEKFNLENLIIIPNNNLFGIPFLFHAITFLMIVFLTFIFTIVPIFLYKRKYIADELRDE